MAAVDSFPETVKDFFDKLGVDLKKPAELMYPFSETNGETLNYWGGFYHICGELINGYDYNAFEGEGIYHIDNTIFHKITDGFSVGFSNYIDLLEDDFPLPVLQIDICFNNVPWVLNEDNPFVEKPKPDTKGLFTRIIEKRRRKREIVLLLKMYARGEYDTASFCNIFCSLYNYANDARSSFSYRERETLDEFSDIVERFSNYEEDLKEYPRFYYTEEKVKEAFEKVKRILNI
ncbi:MAG: hypothetical protein IJS94_04725 [Clostridia bacterium]|nr:hypothetical protein [Clostridia bacterium]